MEMKRGTVEGYCNVWHDGRTAAQGSCRVAVIRCTVPTARVRGTVVDTAQYVLLWKYGAEPKSGARPDVCL